MESTYAKEHFSADVRLDLEIGGRIITLDKVGPRYAIPRERVEIKAGETGCLIMMVDGREHRWRITVEHDVVPFDDKIDFKINRYPQQLSLFFPIDP